MDKNKLVNLLIDAVLVGDEIAATYFARELNKQRVIMPPRERAYKDDKL